MSQSQTFQACGREDDRRELTFIQLAQPGLHIAAQRLNLQMRKVRTQLAFPPQTGSPHDAPGRQFVKPGIVAGNKSVAGIFALPDGRQRKPAR